MGSYLSPGVYVEEVPPLARPIAGVGTSTAGFIGVISDAATLKMPDKPDGSGKYTLADAGKSILVTSWNEFVTNFGEIQAGNSDLAHAVFGFFHNGGTRCWVIHVTALDDLSSELGEFAAIDEIAIVAVPGATTKPIHAALLDHCLQLGDRVAILDGVKDADPPTADNISPEGRSEKGSYGAIYFPWIKVSNPLKKNETITVPPSGHIAGIYARNDARRGVHKAPANEVVLGALGLEKRISKAIQNDLNPEGVNVIREFGREIKVWGGRTRADSGHSEYQYISTRRYMNFLRESIDEGTQWVVFEPNSHSLWQRISRTLTDFLTNQWRQGALFGETPKQAFFVKCDADTNPPDVRELGQVVTEIGVAIVKPAEFVIFRIQQTTGG
ncbi:MAG TPA: phage tail sheath subtilisin-like domain-containing protein [Nitrosomonas sp.]|nr:phage tail sheath subtilisin-like domain-containing protein [Nitrosomonas sp.]HND36633.1 phage tail sheath subtilisin-like domain-containing protein [Nitrosomonas sp.]HNE57935.1 phage tail sheath subtilisin-like domain-containing protein [Nitrosomonas sp.]HNJ91881.1 phage tail sheath subtilisin-like domain-containing protein [Nitrosomonas sp.]